MGFDADLCEFGWDLIWDYITHGILRILYGISIYIYIYITHPIFTQIHVLIGFENGSRYMVRLAI